MFTDLPSYTQTRPSSIAWAPQLPTHWTVARGKSLFFRVERQTRPDDGVVTCFRDGTVTLRSRRRTTGFTEALKEVGYQGIRKGDLVIHAMDAFAGAAGVSDSDGKGTPVYSVCLPRGDANPHYFAAIVREMARSSWIHALSRGIRERSTDFRFETFGNQLLPVPPVEEQAAIVKYLAHANARIDRAVTAKRRLIALLEERVTLAVEKAVIRGLDPHAQFRPADLMWLAEVPANWDVRRGKYLLKTVDIRSETGSEELLTVSSKAGVVRRADTTVYMFQASNYAGHKLCWPGDLVINSLWAWGRGLGVARNHGIVSTAYGVYRVRNPLVLDPGYLHHLVRSRAYNHELQVLSRGIWKSRLQLTDERFLSSRLLVPPLAEQKQIVDVITKQHAELARATGPLRREIALLNEFRTRLVADVLTGQVDVRRIAEPLPEAVTEVDEIDSVIDIIEDLEVDNPMETSED